MTLITLLSGFFVVGAAAPPNIVTYQGRVLNANGVPVSDASINMKFFLYTASAGGTCLWSNSSSDCHSNTPASTTTKSITLSTGLFTENLGDTGSSYSAIPDSVFADNTGVYLEVEIGGETLSPRRRMTSAPYALNAQRLDGIDSTGFLASDGDTATGIFDFTGAVFSGASPLVFEGATADDFETTFAFVDPTADRTITFQNASGTVAFTSDVLNLWSNGSNGVFQNTAAVIVGADAAFTYASGGIGDLRVADELEVIGNAYLGNALTVLGLLTASGGIDLDGQRLDLDVDNDTSIIASTDDQIDWELGGFAQSLIMRSPLVADHASSTINPILEINYATPADTTGINIHAGMLVDIDVGNATGGTNSVYGLVFDAMVGDAEIGNLSAIRIDGLTGSASSNEVAISIAGGWDAGIHLEGSTPRLRINDGASFTLQDNAGNEIVTFADVSSSNNHVIRIDSNTSLQFNSNSDLDADITTGSNQSLRILPNGTGDTVFPIDSDSNVQLVATVVPGVDMLSISNAGQSVTSDNVKALSIAFGAQNASTAAVTIAPSFEGGATDGLSFRAFSITDFSPSNPSGLDAVLGIEIGAVTDPGATISSRGLQINSGWDSSIFLNDIAPTITLIETGVLTINDGAGNSLLTLSDDGTTGTLTVNTLVGTFSSAGAYTHALCWDNSGSSEIQDCVGSVTADYAEMYPVAEGVDYGDLVVPGAVEVTTTQGDTIVRLEKSSEPYSGSVVGIVSNNYGDFTSAGYNIDASDNPMPVALVGRVPVKVTSEGGSISAGDYLTTSSTPGKAMKAQKVGRVIGMALEDWDGVSATVMVQVNNSWSMGEIIGTDGTSTLVTDNVIISPTAQATASETTFGSYGLALRGSAWNGAEASVVEMMLQNVVTSSDEYRLSIRNIAETEVAYITNEGTMQMAGDLIIGGRIYPSDQGVAQTNRYIYYDGSEGAGGDFMRTNAKGWSTGSYDFAEMFPSDQVLQAGDIVAFYGAGHKIRRATGANGERLAGIVSTRPGFLAGENVEGAFPIALAGRVPTKVSTENGVIAVGDPLTASSTAGVAKKATEPGAVAGYALEAYNGTESDNLILAFVNVGHWGGGATSPTPGTDNSASQFASAGTSHFSALNMGGNIYMATHSILSIGRLEGISQLWSVEADGTIKTTALLKTVVTSHQGTLVETSAVTSPEVLITLTGTAMLMNGQAEVRFESVSPEFNDVISAIAPIRVVVTPNGPVSLYVSQKDQNHFVVERFAGSGDVEFDWIVTAYRKGYEPEEVDEEEEVVEAEEVVEVQEVVDSPSVPSVLSDDESTVVEEPVISEIPEELPVDEAPTEPLEDVEAEESVPSDL